MLEPTPLDANPFSVLTASERRELEAEGQHRTFKRAEFLFRSGQPVTGIFCLNAGIVRISQSRGDQEITVRLAASGEWVGHRSVFTSETYRGSASAKEPVRALFVPTDTLLRFFGSNKEFAHHMIRLIAHDLESAERLLMDQQRLNVPSRLISLFRTLDSKFGVASEEGRLLSTKLTKVEIAEMVGASQEVVSRQLSKWKKEDLLREDGKQLFLSNRLLARVIR